MQISVRSQTAAQTTLSWQPVAGAARYRILWSDRSGETVRFKTAGESGESLFTFCRSTHIPYYIKVQALAENGALLEESTPVQTPVGRVLQQQLEALSRGLVTVTANTGVFISWRLFKSEVTGHNATGLTGTEFAQYQRSLYGAALNWRTSATTRWGDPGTELRVFGSQAETAPGHNEFIGTGGSLYYLRHTDLLPGSDVVTLEVRDRTTGRTEHRVVLQRGADYEIDELQGRILLTRPLAQITRENIPTLTRDAPLDGLEQRLLVDYEWVPSGFDADDVSAGLRGKHWFGDHVGVGATYVQENRAGEDYTLAAGDLTLQAGKGTYLKAEYAQTESFGAPVFFSDNGGLSFIQQNDTGLRREGEAKSLEARANFKELGWTELDWSMGAWWRNTSAGYSISRYDTGRAITEYGAEVQGQFSPNLGVYARYTRRGGLDINPFRTSHPGTLPPNIRMARQ